MDAPHTCPACRAPFRLRKYERCPRCSATLVMKHISHEHREALQSGQSFWLFDKDAGTWTFVKGRSVHA